MKNIYSTLFLMCFAFLAKAQDPHYSQFYAAPQQLNPAMTGVFKGQYRATLNYRDQWNSILEKAPFRSINAGFDVRVPAIKDDYVGIGINMMSDKAGVSNFTQNRIHLGASYMKQLGGGRYRSNDQYLVAAFQFGAGQHSLDYGNLWFSEQYDKGTNAPNTTLSSGENGIQANTKVYADFNAGLMWYATFQDNASVYVGGAANHLNGPSVSLMSNTKEKLGLRWLAHAGGEIPMSGELSLLPAFIYMKQGQSTMLNFGANMRYNNHDWHEVAIRMGVWSRLASKLKSGLNTDAIVVTSFLEMEKFMIGLSYDINVSKLNIATNNRGAFEISLIYNQPENRRNSAVNCPKF
jgi:type IX secretion system PorP/SprF family membrane protein